MMSKIIAFFLSIVACHLLFWLFGVSWVLRCVSFVLVCMDALNLVVPRTTSRRSCEQRWQRQRKLHEGVSLEAIIIPVVPIRIGNTQIKSGKPPKGRRCLFTLEMFFWRGAILLEGKLEGTQGLCSVHCLSA